MPATDFGPPLPPAARDIARAAIAVVAEQGFDQLSVRRVAAQAQVAPGTVQHYFPSRTALLTAAFRQTVDDIAQRATWPPPEAPLSSRLKTLLAHALPLDEQRRREGTVWVALSAAAAVQPALTAIHAQAVGAFCGLLAEVMTESGVATQQAAVMAPALVALVDGLTMHGIAGAASAAELTKRLDWFINEVVSK